MFVCESMNLGKALRIWERDMVMPSEVKGPYLKLLLQLELTDCAVDGNVFLF